MGWGSSYSRHGFLALALASVVLVALCLCSPTAASSSSSNGPPDYGFWKSVPRWDFGFHSVSKSFDPDSQSYRQSLAWWFIIATAIGSSLLLAGILFWTCRCCFPSSCGGNYPQESFCCSGGERKRPYTSRSRVTTALTLCFFLMSISACLVIAFLGNEELNTAINGFRDYYGKSTTNTANAINSVIGSLKSLEGVADSDPDFTTARQSASTVSNNWWAADNDIKHYNSIRYTASLVVLGTLSFFALVGVVALLSRKGGFFKALAVFGFLMIFLAWVMAGSHFAGGLAVSDYCRDSYSYSQNNALDSQVSSSASSPIFKYLDCSRSFQGMASLVTRLESGQVTKLAELNTVLASLNPAKSATLSTYSAVQSEISSENISLTSSQKLNVERLVSELSMYSDAIAKGNSLRSCTYIKQGLRLAEEESCPDAIHGTNFVWTASLVMGFFLVAVTTCLVVLGKRYGPWFTEDKLAFDMSSGKMYLPTSADDDGISHRKPLRPASSSAARRGSSLDLESGGGSGTGAGVSRQPLLGGSGDRTTPPVPVGSGGRTTPTGPGGRASPTVRNGPTRAEARRNGGKLASSGSGGKLSRQGSGGGVGVGGGGSADSAGTAGVHSGSAGSGGRGRMRSPGATYSMRSPQ